MKAFDENELYLGEREQPKLMILETLWEMEHVPFIAMFSKSFSKDI